MAFPQTELPRKVEVFLGGTWTDITSYVLTENDIEIVRGRPDETATVDPGRASFMLDNTDGRFSPRNPTGAYYGQIGRNTPFRITVTEAVDSAPQFDASSFFSGTATGDFSFTHTPAGDARGILVFIVQDAGITDEVVGVTYGGVAMTEVPGSPLISSAGAEDGVVYCFHLGSGIPQGPQTVAVDVNATASVKDAWAISVTADSTTTVIEDTTTLDSAGVANPSVALTTTVKTFLAAALHSGHDATSSIAATSPAVALSVSTDFGTATAKVFYRADAPSGSPTIGATAASEEAGLLGVAVKNGPDISRFYGEVPAWPQTWSVLGTDVQTSIEAAGILRRLGQGAKPLRSALTRQVPMKSFVKAYWPMEDERFSTRMGSGLPSGVPMLVGGAANVRFAQQDGPGGSAPLPIIQSGGSAFGKPPKMSPASVTPWRVDWLFFIDAQPPSDRTCLTIYTSSDSAYRWEIRAGTNLSVQVATDDETVFHTTSVATDPAFWGNWIRFDLSVSQSGTTVSYIAHATAMDGTVLATWNTSLASSRYGGQPTNVGLRVLSEEDRSIGHVTVSADTVLAENDPFATAYNGYTGEAAGTRFARLCGEEAVFYRIIGDPAATQQMGPQRVATLLENLQACADSDSGILFEPREFLGLGLRTREGLYNQTAVLAASYIGEVLGTVPEPIDDDQLTRNDVTVSRDEGSSARAVLEEGPLSIQDPPDGVGVYDEQVTVNVASDDDLANIAGWRLHLGTVDEARYPTIDFDLAQFGFTNSAALTMAAVTLDIGDRLTLSNPPAWLPPDLITQLAQGFTEIIGDDAHSRRIVVNCTPELPWQVAVFDTDRFDTAGSQLNSSATSGATSISVATTQGPLWTTVGGDFPFDIMIGGERMTVTAISGASSPQTFTVTRSVNGVVKAHSAGEAVTLFQVPVFAL